MANPTPRLPRALEIFLTGLLDYAGTFPPAKLPLEGAVGTLLESYAHPLGFLVGNFVCAQANLQALGQLLPEPPASPAGRGLPTVTVLLSPLTHENSSVDMLELELRAIAAQAGAAASRMRVAALEVALVDDDFYHSDQVFASHFLRRFARLAGELFGSSLACYFEPKRTTLPGGPSFDRGLRPLLFTLRTLRAETFGGAQVDVGVKLRTGGVTKEAFPDVAELASSLVVCRDLGLPVKATAGLHQPLRHFDEALGCDHHGFLNVFVAATLARTHVLSQADVETILASRDPAFFRFSDEGLECGGRWRVGLADLRRARQVSARGFGSCSFSEAAETLASLGFVPSLTAERRS